MGSPAAAMSYSFVYTAAALLGLMTPMDQALMTMLENPALERSTVTLPDPPALPLRPENGRWDTPPIGAITPTRPLPRSLGVVPDAPRRSKRHPERPTSARVPQRPVTGYTAHLASYLGETWAHRGWSELKERAPSLGAVEPGYRHAQVPVLGAVIRVTVGRYGTLAEAANFCAKLRSALEYCAPLPLHGDGPAEDRRTD